MKLCTIDWCKNNWSRHWVCETHIYRFSKYWMYEIPEKAKRICKVDWCGEIYSANWFCKMHNLRFWKTWSVEEKRRWKWKHILYGTYCNMISRCFTTNRNDYQYYWGRWITVCDRWLWKDWFWNFTDDMWDRPEWLTLDRINNDWPYSPENCRWANMRTQTRNRRMSIETPCIYHIGKSWKVAIFHKKKTHRLWTFRSYEEAQKVLDRFVQENEISIW